MSRRFCRRRWLATGGASLALLLLAGTAAGVAWATAPDSRTESISAARPYTLTLAGLSKDGVSLVPVGQQGFTTSALVSASRDLTRISVAVVAAASGAFVVDVETYGPSGARVDQQWFDNEPFAAGQTRSFTVEWRPPAEVPAGSYTVKVGLFRPGPDWQVLYHWNDRAAVFALP
ncbi:MAG: hypothetical protein IT304_10655 [Dehalococcoidia bacterium]|nr:hypothetical protein [Dehalococcoidia bacterium]